ncbi:MAG: CDP-glycerol glycerophosphotransferase family protein [Microthrixaceae bacterium]|nr:CDP-glycerol glycerophosphotransferase family protein [Microthrixaceae bacterium]
MGSQLRPRRASSPALPGRVAAPLAVGGRVARGLAQRLARRMSSWSPRTPDRWVFAGRADAYVDNPRYLFEHVADHHRAIEATWISGDPAVVQRVRAHGRRAERRWSARGIRATLRAGVAVYSFDPGDVNVALTGGAVGVNLYHGVPLKQIEGDIRVGSAARVYHPSTPIDRLRAATVYYPRTLANDLVLATSPDVAAEMQRAFGRRARRMLIGRPPRLAGALHTSAATERPDDAEATSVLLYAPTWRVPPGFDLAEALGDLGALEEALRRDGSRLLVKAHLYDRVTLPRSARRIELLDSESDINEVLGTVDGLITDYSSVMFDAALLGLPIVFYPFDLDEYRRHSSESFSFDYDQLVEGRAARRSEELIDMIGSGAWRSAGFPGSVRDRVWGPGDQPSVPESNRRLVAEIAAVADERFGS